ncbi:MAG: hypothetical protein A3H69_00575 [Candidatus Sungbacteria bacterium RIFCSPLOWO2_02_FULL_47_9]|nr:MAG: hypothetical protein A3H69_00575 [Candidatus Sungbacteria bacterium RIFCSPLOWO2_02_FULL_47_9]
MVTFLIFFAGVFMGCIGTGIFLRKREASVNNRGSASPTLRGITIPDSDVVHQRDKFAAIFSSIREGIVVVDKGHNITFINQAAGSLLRVAPAEVLGKALELSIFLFKESKPYESKTQELLQGVILSTDIISGDVLDRFSVRTNDGKSFPIAFALTTLLEGNEIAGAIMVFRDVTKEREIDREKSEFVSLASHQLRTPISSINWYAEMLLSGDAGRVSKKQKQYLDEIYKGSQRSTDLIRSLLNVSRIELGKFPIDPETVKVKDLVGQVCRDLLLPARKKKIKITENYAPEIPAIAADPRLLTMAVQNIISNAISYTPAGGHIFVSVAFEGTKDHGGTKTSKKDIVITVSDSGYGIPKAEQPKIFTKMYRADNVKKLKDTEGTGLGLYIARSVIQHAGGNIRFESEEGKGTTFYITVPLVGMKKREGTRRLE